MNVIDALEDEDFCEGVDLPTCAVVSIDDIPSEDLGWAEHIGLLDVRVFNEGATFTKIGENAEVIAVRGGQFLHHDRHIADGSVDSPANHTWNLVLDGDGSQMLLQAVAQGVFTHHALERGAFIFMNTLNHHAVSRQAENDVCVIVQVSGFTAEQPDEAFAALRLAISQRRIIPRF